MSNQRSRPLWMLIGTLLALAAPLLGLVLCACLLSELRVVHVPVHTLMESAGGMIALAIGFILISERQHREDSSHYPIVAAAFVGMGILDLFHGASAPSDYFVLMRALASFVGGVLFGATWFNKWGLRWIERPQIVFVVAATTILLGLCGCLFPSLTPVMWLPSGEFSILAHLLKLAGGIGFLLASVFFGSRYLKNGATEDWLFAMQSVLFGTAGCLFPFSVVWDCGWWWWHLMRLAAYVMALIYGLRTFREAEREILRVNRQLAETNATLDCTVHDRTAKLLASEERFELAVRGSTDGLWDWDIPKNEVYYSTRLKELLGYADHEVSAAFSEFETRLHPDDFDWVLQALKDHLEHRRPYDVQYRLRTKAGQFRWYRARGQALWNEAGQAYRMAGSITDVTEEHALRERFQLAVEASPAALLIVEESGRIRLANSVCLTLFGYTEQELVGQQVEILIPASLRETHIALRQRYFRTPTRRAMGDALNLVAVRRDGSEFPVKVGLSPVQTADGLMAICGVLDISETVSAMETMRQAKEVAESASRAKSSFLANMSHEIRTPMNGIIGMAQLLSRTELKPHQREYLQTVEESARILLRLLNDILDFSKIEAGKLELERVLFRLSECVARASQMLLLRAAEKGVELAFRISPEIPDYLLGDSGRLQQVLVNLLGNAVKFTETGEIFVNVNAESVSDERVRLHFSVKDTGIGIAADKLDQIFSPFEQAEASTTRRFGGTGLGLTISRQLVEMMGGRMWVESEVGRGSTFHFLAEFDVAASQHAHTSAELSSLRDMPVLIVDDNATNRRILSELLRHWNMHPIQADSATAGRTALQQAAQDRQAIRLILLDHHMPEEDGVQFMSSVREFIDAQGSRVIMISSGSLPLEEDQLRKLGIVRFMSKPVIASELLNEILREFGTRPDQVSSESAGPVREASVLPRRVLLVEDNEINRRVALGLLDSRGHQTVVAENGLQAVERLANEEFDVVLMDMQMPVMDGYEATSLIRQREQQSGGHVPIVAMTAEALRGDRERCLELGMDDYVSKPIDHAELNRAIEQFPALCLAAVNSTEPQMSRSASDTLTVKSSESRSVEPKAAQPSLIDWKLTRSNLGDDPALLRETSEIALNQTTELLADIHRAIRERNAPLLRRAAHTLKGTCVYFGAQTLVEAAQMIEERGREGSTDVSPIAMYALEVELDRFRTELQQAMSQFC